MKNANDYNLDAMVADIAVEIFAEERDVEDARELAHQYADGNEWVIYHYKAHQLCQGCNTDRGEEWLEAVGMCETPTYDWFASTIAYGEILGRLSEALEGLYEMQDEMNEVNSDIELHAFTNVAPH